MAGTVTRGVATALVCAGLGVGAAVGVSACGEDREGDVEIEQGTTGGGGTTGGTTTGGATTGETGTDETPTGTTPY